MGYNWGINGIYRGDSFLFDTEKFERKTVTTIISNSIERKWKYSFLSVLAQPVSVGNQKFYEPKILVYGGEKTMS